MRFFRVILFVAVFFLSSVVFAQVNMTGLGDALNQRTGETSLTSEQRAELQAQGQNDALKRAGYSDAEIEAYNKKIEERKAAIKNGNKENMPQLTDKEKEMGKVSEKARRKVNAQINKLNSELKGNNQSVMDAMGDWFASKDWTGFADTLNKIGLGAAAIGGGALAAAGALALGATPLGWGLIAGAAGAALASWIYDKLTNADVPTFERILASFLSIGRGSWLSPVFESLFNATNELTVKLNTNLGADVVKILYILMLFYILYTVTKTLVSFSPIEPSKLVSELFFPLGRCLLAVWAIKNWQVMFDLFVTNLLNAGITFGNEIAKYAGSGPAESYVASLSGGKEAAAITCSSASTVNGGLSISVCNSIQSFLTTVSQNLIVWMAVGATFVYDSFAEGWMGILPSFSMIFIGLVMFIFAFLVYVSFPLKFIDVLFRLMFVLALFPLWCAFWVIPQTRNYTKNAFNMFLNVLATFICAAVVLVMVIGILTSLFKGIDFSGLISLLKEGKTKDAMAKIGFSTSSLFYSTCLLFMAFHLVGKIEYFTNLFVKQDSLGIGAGMSKATTTVIQSSPKAIGMAKNATAWGVGKVAGAAVGAWGAGKAFANRARARSYNNSAPGGSARQSPRLWTANSLTERYDRYKAKKAGTGYTGDVQVGKVQKAADGSTSQTYSNTTYDKDNNVKARMQETTTSNADKSKQSVNRNVTHLDADGNVHKTANVKKDFENGQAVRKTTTMKDKNGNRVDLSVDKKTGLATKTKYDASGRKLSTEIRGRGGERSLENYKPDGTVEKSTRDADGIERSRSITRTDGSKETFRYSKDRLPNGKAAQFETLSTDASGGVTRHLRVDAANDSYTDVLTGTTGKWSDYNRRP